MFFGLFFFSTAYLELLRTPGRILNFSTLTNETYILNHHSVISRTLDYTASDSKYVIHVAFSTLAISVLDTHCWSSNTKNNLRLFRTCMYHILSIRSWNKSEFFRREQTNAISIFETNNKIANRDWNHYIFFFYLSLHLFTTTLLFRILFCIIRLFRIICTDTLCIYCVWQINDGEKIHR